MSVEQECKRLVQVGITTFNLPYSIVDYPLGGFLLTQTNPSGAMGIVAAWSFGSAASTIQSLAYANRFAKTGVVDW